MVRVTTRLFLMALVLGFAGSQPASAADKHWFYEDETIHGDDSHTHFEPRHSHTEYRPQPAYPVNLPARPPVRQQRYYEAEHVSCLQGVEVLKASGFRYIEVVDCHNGSYVYEAVRGREPWRIRLSRSSGELIDAVPLN